MKIERIFFAIFCLVFISLGIFFYKSKNVSTIILKTKETEIKNHASGAKVSIVSEQRKGYWSTENTNIPIWIEKDPLTKSAKETAFDVRIKNYINKEFYRIPSENTQSQKSKILHSKKLWIENYILNNESWYRSDYHDDLSDSKVTLFFNFYNCSSSVRCFKVLMYNFRNDNWFFTTEVTSLVDMRWKNNTAYTQIRLENLGDFTRHTGTWYLMIPVPRDSMPIYYIKYDDNKFSLEKGQDSEWVLITEEEVEKFQIWAKGYKVKHGETPEP